MMDHEAVYIVARRHLTDVADAYDELDERLHNGTEHVGGDRPRATADDGEVTLKLTAAPAPADLQAAVVRMEVAAWATWCARAVIDARDDAGQPWHPDDADPAEVLRDVRDDHLGVFLADPLTAADFLDTAQRHAKRARAAAWPTGERWIRLGVPCPETGMDDLGRRLPCGGEYRMWMQPDQDTLGDMVCDRDGAHRITPAQWFQAMRKRPNPAAAARFVRNLRLARNTG